MPTTITGQNGIVTKQNTKIGTTGCPVEIVGHKVIGNTVYLTVKTFAAGRISGSGSGLATVSRTLNGASGGASLKVPLSSSGRSRGRPFSVKVRVGFLPKKPGSTPTPMSTVVLPLAHAAPAPDDGAARRAAPSTFPARLSRGCPRLMTWM